MPRKLTSYRYLVRAVDKDFNSVQVDAKNLTDAIKILKEQLKLEHQAVSLAAIPKKVG